MTSSTHRLETRCRFGDSEAPATDMTPSRVVCKAPPQLDVGAQNITVSLNGAPEDHVGGPAFSYFQLNLSAVTPPAGPTGGGTRVVVSGSGFEERGGIDDAPAPYGRRLLCSFGGAGGAIVNATLVSSTALRCDTPPALAGAALSELSISLNGFDFTRANGSGVRFRYFNSPEILAISPIGGPVRGRTTVTITLAESVPYIDLTSRCRFGSVDAFVSAAVLTLHNTQRSLLGAGSNSSR